MHPNPEIHPEGPARRPAWAEPTARRLGRYLVGPILGQGGMGVVHEAWDTVLGRAVALKRLTVPSDEAWARFLREGHAQARIQHPNICPVYDVDSVDGLPVIAMQLIHGSSLWDMREGLGRPELLRLMIQVAQALHAAHQGRVIHRDIKPGNILVERSETGLHPFICDFGLAKDLLTPGFTESLAQMGTLGFMAPEQARGDHALISPGTDVFGVGATLYAMLLGKPPDWNPEGVDSRDRLARVDGWASLPRDLRTILAKALEWEQRDRYVSTAALAEDLRRFLEGEPLATRAAGPVDRLRRRARKQPLLTALLALSVVGAIGAGIWALRSIRSARRGMELAQHFALEAKEIEHLLRLERMLPPHDLRPALRKASGRIEELRGHVEQAGPAAEGPGQYALGRALLAVGESEGARAALDRAWAAGFQVPEVAYGLGRAHCDLFWRGAREAGFRGDFDEVRRLREEHLTLARQFFAKSPGQTIDPQKLGETITARIGRDAKVALELSRDPSLEGVWAFDARAQEVSAAGRLAFECFIKADIEGAERYYREARIAAEAGRKIGQSDEWTLIVDLDWRLTRAFWQIERGVLKDLDFQELEALAERLLLLNPDRIEGVTRKLYVVSLKALADLAQGKDPEAGLVDGIAFLKHQPPQLRERSDAKVDWMVLHWLLAEAALRKGADPQPHLSEALRDPGFAEYRLHEHLGDVLNFKARLELAQGKDPRPTLDDLIRRLTPTLAPRNNYYYLHEILGEAHLTRAEFERKSGLDARPTLNQAAVHFKSCLERNPWIRVARENLKKAEAAGALVQK